MLAPWSSEHGRVLHPVTISTGDATLAGANCPQAYHGSAIGLWLQSCYDEPPPATSQSHPPFGDARANATPRTARAGFARRDRARRADMGVFNPAETITASGDDGRAQRTSYVAMISFWLLAPVGLGGLVVLHRRKVPVLPLVAQFVLVTLRRCWSGAPFVFASRPTSCSSSAWALPLIGSVRFIGLDEPHLVNAKSARAMVPSMNVNTSWRHVFFHAASVFQT